MLPPRMAKVTLTPALSQVEREFKKTQTAEPVKALPSALPIAPDE